MGTMNHLQTLWNSFKTLVQAQAAFEEQLLFEVSSLAQQILWKDLCL